MSTRTPNRKPLAVIKWKLDALNVLRHELPKVLYDSGAFRPNCCIAATRIVLDVCTGLDIPAEPAVCEVLLFSPGWLKLRDKLKREPTVEEMNSELGHNAWSVGLGVEDRPANARIENPRQYFDPTLWSGHLVTIARVGPQPFLLDGTLKQAERPQYGILTPPFVFLPISNATNSITRPCEGTPLFTKPGGTLMAMSEPEPERGPQLYIYRRRKRWTPFDDAPDFHPLRYIHIVLGLGRTILEEVGECPA